MSQLSRLAVEITKGDDFLNIWVDANNNGVRDDDDVNIFISKCGGLFAQSPTFKQSLDAHLKQRLQEASVALMTTGHDTVMEDQICDLALEMVVRACRQPDVAAAAPVEQPHEQTAAAGWSNAAANFEATQPEFTEHGIPVYRPQ